LDIKITLRRWTDGKTGIWKKGRAGKWGKERERGDDRVEKGMDRPYFRTCLRLTS